MKTNRPVLTPNRPTNMETRFKLVPAAKPEDDPPVVDGQTWGPWRYDARHRVLVYTNRRVSSYEIDLDRCTTSAEVLDWIMQLAGKDWLTPDEVGELILAFRDVLHPQQNLCGSGRSKTMDVRKWLAS